MAASSDMGGETFEEITPDSIPEIFKDYIEGLSSEDMKKCLEIYKDYIPKLNYEYMKLVINLNKRLKYGNLGEYGRILNMSDIGCRVSRAVLKFSGTSYRFIVNCISILDNIEYNDLGHITRYLMHIGTEQQYGIADAELFDGWVCIDDIGG